VSALLHIECRKILAVTAGIWGESSPDGGAAVAAKPWKSHAAIRLKRALQNFIFG